MMNAFASSATHVSKVNPLSTHVNAEIWISGDAAQFAIGFLKVNAEYHSSSCYVPSSLQLLKPEKVDMKSSGERMPIWTVSDDNVRNLGYLEIERETDLTGYDLVLNIDLCGKDMDSTGDWMSAVRELVYSWDPVEEALIAAGCPDAPSVDRIIEDFKSTYESSICGIEAVCQIVTNAWDEKTATEGIHSESLDQMCERASSTIDVPMDDSRAVGRSEDIDK